MKNKKFKLEMNPEHLKNGDFKNHALEDKFMMGVKGGWCDCSFIEAWSEISPANIFGINPNEEDKLKLS